MASVWIARYLTKCVACLFALVALCGAPHASAQAYCYVGETSSTDPYNSDGRPVYFTVMPATYDQDHRAASGGLFIRYVEKKYSVQHHGPSYCAGAGMQERIAYFKAHGSTVVMTDWAPGKHEALMAELAKNPPPPPPTAAPAAKKNPPPSEGQTAYEKALAAERPRSVTQEQLAAGTKTPAPSPNRASAIPASTAPSAGTTAEKYSFCYSTGSPLRGPGQSHYYVTQLFPTSAADPRRGSAFGAYLHGQHPQESISSSWCSTPQARSTEESARRSYIENQRKIPNRAIVELTWKPAS